MRSDHWNFLANLLGAPGAAEPPKEAEPPAAEPTEAEQEASEPVAAAAEEVRSRPEPDEPTVPREAESIDFGSFDEPSAGGGPSEVADADEADDVLEALTAVTPPPKLPGFGVLDDQEPDEVEASDETASVAPQRAPAERTARGAERTTRGARGDRSEEPRSRRRSETWDEADSAVEEPAAKEARRDRPAAPAGEDENEEETRPRRRRRRGVRQRLSEGELPADAGTGAAGAGAGRTETVEDEDKEEEEEPFGMGVADESGEDETTARGRSRRRGRRGRGRSGGRSEQQDRGAEEPRAARVAEPTPDSAPEPIGQSAFDDDHEDDEEVEVIRRGRRRRSRRDRGGEEERATGEPDMDVEDEGPRERDRGDSERGSASRGRRRSATPRDETDEPPKRKNVPTWLDTVTLFVDSNLENHKKSGRGGGSRGRSGRRR